MDKYPIRHGLLVEDRISLLNRLSTFYSMSEFFFSLDRDTVRTANDHNINVPLKPSEPITKQFTATAEKIKEICDRLRLLDIVSTDNGNIVKKKMFLRQKLLYLTKNLTETK